MARLSALQISPLIIIFIDFTLFDSKGKIYDFEVKVGFNSVLL